MIMRDIDRSLWDYCEGEHLREQKRGALMRMINAILCDHPQLNYFQGFHDVCSVFLMVCGEQLGGAVAEFVALHHLCDNMRPSFDVALQVLGMVFPLLSLEDHELFAHMTESGIDPHFAISWHLTWLAHNFKSLSKVSRLFDFLLASHSLMPVYITVAILMHMRSKVLEVEAEYTAVYSCLQNLPQDLPLDDLIVTASHLSSKVPPRTLAVFAKIRFDRSLMAEREPPLWARRRLEKEDVQIWLRETYQGAIVATKQVSRVQLLRLRRSLPWLLAIAIAVLTMSFSVSITEFISSLGLDIEGLH